MARVVSGARCQRTCRAEDLSRPRRGQPRGAAAPVGRPRRRAPEGRPAGPHGTPVKVVGDTEEGTAASLVQAMLGSRLAEKMSPPNNTSHSLTFSVRIANDQVRRCRRWPTEGHTRSPAPRSAVPRLSVLPVIRTRGIACWRLSAARGAAGCQTSSNRRFLPGIAAAHTRWAPPEWQAERECRASAWDIDTSGGGAVAAAPGATRPRARSISASGGWPRWLVGLSRE